jgi:hypothetical protein
MLGIVPTGTLIKPKAGYRLCCFKSYMLPSKTAFLMIYRVFRAQADWTLIHTSHNDTEQSTIEASVTLDGVTLTDSLIR